MKILDELFYGNIDPFARPSSYRTEIREVSDLCDRNKEKLLASLSSEQKELLQKWEDCLEEYQRIDDRYMFLHGFRLGVRLSAEALADES